MLDDDGGVASDIATAASGTATYVAETKTEIETNTATVDVTGNQAPTAIALSASSFNENAAGATVGTLSPQRIRIVVKPLLTPFLVPIKILLNYPAPP